MAWYWWLAIWGGAGTILALFIGQLIRLGEEREHREMTRVLKQQERNHKDGNGRRRPDYPRRS